MYYSICKIVAVILWSESQVYKFVIYFFFGCKARICNKWLYQYCTNMTIAVFRKANHVILTIWKILVVRFYTFKERSPN